MNRDEADIDIRKLVKIWDTTGQVAVDSLSLRAYRGQVTVLLGHNGAGKSTTFSVIAGSTSPSCGNILICKEDIVENLRECQRNIGYCPQYNPLFEKLTAREHLRLYAKLKTGKDQRNVEDDLSSQLSGGMKRKLCVGMSLIGNSRVILLDEPTAGMDPGARHDIRVLLERAKRDRTILLTTHYMDEADLLGDRIAIMVKGRIVCNGSPTFLKNKFGTGYVLSVVVSTTPNPMDKIDSFDAKIDRILRVVRKHAPDARVDKTSHPQFSLILPTQYKKHFADLFYELEQRKDELSVDSFGLSFNTLEQVFLRVGELADPHEDEVDAGGEITGRAAAMRHEADTVSVPVLLARQILALLYRHWLNALRNKWRTLLPVLLSVFIFAAFAGSVKYQTRQKIERREFNLATIDPVSVPLQLIGSGGGGMPGPDFPYIANKMKTTDSVRIPENAHLQRTLVRLAYRSPPLGIGAAVNTAAGNNTIVALFNGAAHHVPPMALLLLSNAFVKNQPDSIRFSIELVNMPFSETTMAMVLALVSTMAVSIIVILAFSSLTSTFAMVLVEDRESRFKNQLLFTRLHIGVYWLAVTLWFLLFYALFCLLIAAVFFAFGWLQSCMGETLVLWALYFWCCIPFVYCFSFMFDSPIKAFTAFLAWNVVVSLVAVITVAGLSFANATLRDILATVFYLFLPSFSLGDGM
ncbi:ABC transporter ced-7, partial [Aphelenchoides avenae]